MAQKTYRQLVTKIEEKQGEQGPFKMVSFKKKDGSIKEKKVWGDIAKVFTAPGQYECTYDEDSHFLVAAKSAEALAALQAAISAAHPSGDNRARSIEAQCAMKATATILAGYAAAGKDPDTLVNYIPEFMGAFVSTADKLCQPVE